MRAASLGLGVLTLLAAWTAPLLPIGSGPFAEHMAIHMGIVAIAAPLLAAGVAGGPLDPVRRLPRVFSPIPASVVELVVVWTWHAPALHHAARTDPLALVLEQGTFLASGLLLWLSAFGGDRRDRAARAGAGVLALLLTSMHMTLLGALLALPPRPLYPHGANLPDQHLGGAIMLLVGGVSYLAGALWLVVGLLRRPRVEPA